MPPNHPMVAERSQWRSRHWWLALIGSPVSSPVIPLNSRRQLSSRRYRVPVLPAPTLDGKAESGELGAVARWAGLAEVGGTLPDSTI